VVLDPVGLIVGWAWIANAVVAVIIIVVAAVLFFALWRW
jgi:hypothetical protein